MNKFLCFIVVALSVTQLQAQQLAANFDYASFHGETPYLETYISVNASTVIFPKKANNQYQGEIGIVLMLTDQEGVTKFFDKYNLLSPEIIDSSQLDFHFIDQQRIALAEGDYTLTLSIVDANSNDEPYTHQQAISFWSAKDVSFSSIQFVESYETNATASNINKNGIDLNPMASNVFYTSQKLLHFYTELYQITDPFVFSYYITSAENKMLVGNLAKSKVQKAQEETHVFLGTLPLDKLASGSYILVCEAKDQTGTVVAKQEKFFYRINEEYQAKEVSVKGTFVDAFSQDQLIQYIDYIYPIQGNREGITAESVVKSNNIDQMKKFFYQFWKNRYPLDPEDGWNNYLLAVSAVDKEFGNGRIKGYRTDRGRVYLQYGAPNSRQKAYFEESEAPFEVWHYLQIANQTDCRFLFTAYRQGTSMDLVVSNVDGEVTNNEWLMRFERDNPGKHFDNNSPLDYFTNPR